MSKEFSYSKRVEGNRLHNELNAAGYAVETIYSKANEAYCVVVLPDSETKDPTPIVDAHVPYQKTAEELAEELADQRIAELRVLLKQGGSVIVSAPATGEYRIISIERNGAGMMNAKYNDVPE